TEDRKERHRLAWFTESAFLTKARRATKNPARRSRNQIVAMSKTSGRNVTAWVPRSSCGSVARNGGYRAAPEDGKRSTLVSGMMCLPQRIDREGERWSVS